MTPGERKQFLRNRMRALRSGLSPAFREAAEREVAARLLALPAFSEPQLPVTAVYLAKAGELSLDAFTAALLNREATVAAPVYIKDRAPHFALLERMNELYTGALGLRHPPPGAPRVPDERLEVIILPGLAFDKNGARLGYGGGWYDKVCAGLRSETLKIGLCFNCQVIEAVPCEPHDALVDIIVTESQTIHVLRPDH